MQNSGAVLDNCSFVMEMLFPLHSSKKEESGKGDEREPKKRDGLLKLREQGELKPAVEGKIVLFYRMSSFSNVYGNNFSLLFLLP